MGHGVNSGQFSPSVIVQKVRGTNPGGLVLRINILYLLNFK